MTTNPLTQSDLPKKKAFFSIWKILYLVLFLLACLVLLIVKIMKSQGYELIYPDISITALVLTILIPCVFLIQTLRFFIKQNLVKQIVSILLSIGCAIFVGMVAIYGYALSTLLRNAHYSYVSPTGKNTLVVMQSGLFDPVFHAFPQHGVFYLAQDNGFLSYHDFGTLDNRALSVTWKTEEWAIIQVNYTNHLPNSGSNANDEIHVQFD